ncbi:MAG: hypothetical protein JXB23_12400 [Candidatus Aminicenantes bacterium]|nr:hypothetical protein [Candidatus Aminicenantes bacterium]
MHNLDALWKRGKKFLGVTYPIIAGAMTWIPDSDVILGSLMAGQSIGLVNRIHPLKKAVRI